MNCSDMAAIAEFGTVIRPTVESRCMVSRISVTVPDRFSAWGLSHTHTLPGSPVILETRDPDLVRSKSPAEAASHEEPACVRLQYSLVNMVESM